jgi:hypothetical protein
VNFRRGEKKSNLRRSFCAFGLVWVLIGGTLARAAHFNYQLTVNSEGYDLSIKMGFRKGVTLAQVRGNLRDPFLLTQFNPSIKSVRYSPETTKDYQSEMVTQSWGLSSLLVSKCHETDLMSEAWNRNCELSTNLGQGGKFMEWKKDATFCTTQENSQEVTCRIDISGKAKPVSIAGLTLISERTFTLKAKEPAVKHFLQLWLYGNQGSYSSSLTKNTYEEIGFREVVENGFQKALRNNQSAVAEVTGTFELPD